MNMSKDYYMETTLLWNSINKVGRGYIWTISPIVNSIANIKDKHKYVLKIYINNDLIDVKFSSCNGLTLQQCTCALRALNVWRIHLFFWNYYVVDLGIQHLCRPQKLLQVHIYIMWRFNSVLTLACWYGVAPMCRRKTRDWGLSNQLVSHRGTVERTHHAVKIGGATGTAEGARIGRSRTAHNCKVDNSWLNVSKLLH